MAEKKCIRIKFYDNDFAPIAIGVMKALIISTNIEKSSEEFILEEFKFLIHKLANLNFRQGISGYKYINKEYFDQCKIESLNYIPRQWSNSEIVIYDIEKGDVYTI